VFFDTSRLDPEIQKWLNLNPMAVLIQQFRGVLLHAQTPDWAALGIVALVSLILTVTGLALLNHYNRKLPNYVN
jgi:lipopolysaccharide transport system permease protein